MSKRKNKIKFLAAIISSVIIATYALSYLKTTHVSAKETPWVTMYMEPNIITNLKPGDEFSINIKIKNFTDLYGWQVGIQWDPSILYCTDVLYGKAAWPESIFAVLAPARTTLPMTGTIDNAAGQIYPPYAESLTGTGGVTGATPETGYNLMKVTFRVMSYAPEGTEIRFNISDPYGPVSCWSKWPNVAELLTPAFENATIYTVAPAVPESPIANFTWSPINPIVFHNVTFDASVSTPGFDGTAICPITEYRWDFDGDGTFELNTTDPVVIHKFDWYGDYDVTLEVYAPGNYPPDVPDTDRITKTVTVSPPPPTPVSPTTVYIDQPVINATTIGQTITVTVKIKDFIQLWGWQLGVKWDPTILNCTSVTAGQELSTSVFKVLAPGRFTIYIPATINQTGGYIIPAAECLTYPGEGVTGEAGVSYDLMKLTFEVKGTGVTNLHLYEVATTYYPPISGTPPEGQTIIIDTYTVRTNMGDFTIYILTNSTGLYSDIYGHTFSMDTKELHFIILARSYKIQSAETSYGFANVTIPKALVTVTSLDEWVVFVNGEAVAVTPSQNATHYFLYFTYPHRTDGDPTSPYPHEIIIVPEYLNPMLAVLVLTAFATLLIKKQLYKRQKTTR